MNTEREIDSRETGGIVVRLVLAANAIPGEEDELWLTVDCDENHRATKLTETNALDAFAHPMLYVEDPHVFSRN